MPARVINVVVGGKEPPLIGISKKRSPFESCLSLTRSDRAFRLCVSGALKPLKLSVMHWLLLGCVNQGADDGASHSILAKKLGVSAPQITVLVTFLIKNRLIKQKTSRLDQRQRRVYLTIKGQTIVEDADSFVATALTEFWRTVPESYLSFYERVSYHLG